MFSEKVQKRLDMIQEESLDVSGTLLELREQSDEGRAELRINVNHPCILFKNLEKKKLQYFKNGHCADYVMFEDTGDAWILHIFEFKRTVTGSRWQQEIKDQFRGALQNAMAIAGFLSIPVKFDSVCLYTVYRFDKINDVSNPARLRIAMHEKNSPGTSQKDNDWNRDKVKIDFLDADEMTHKKIPLDVVNGRGWIEIL